MTQTPVRVHGGRVDHTAIQERPGRWRMACGALPVSEADFERPLCGKPCTGCARALRDAADPAAAALRAHTTSVHRRQQAGHPPLPGSEPRLDAAAHRAQSDLRDRPRGVRQGWGVPEG
ncbi:hypothetical protein ACIQF5_20695 [Streptomyces goshikiensis]|uniref:hypothetical protein n=1 Tax=Streptomyces goshikiensis TaxID=1942 RepID=UPI0037F73DCD